MAVAICEVAKEEMRGKGMYLNDAQKFSAFSGFQSSDLQFDIPRLILGR